jgi:hypothetical protein
MMRTLRFEPKDAQHPETSKRSAANPCPSAIIKEAPFWGFFNNYGYEFEPPGSTAKRSAAAATEGS